MGDQVECRPDGPPDKCAYRQFFLFAADAGDIDRTVFQPQFADGAGLDREIETRIAERRRCVAPGYGRQRVQIVDGDVGDIHPAVDRIHGHPAGILAVERDARSQAGGRAGVCSAPHVGQHPGAGAAARARRPVLPKAVRLHRGNVDAGIDRRDISDTGDHAGEF